MKYYAVIDTNVIVSSFLKDESIPNAIVQMALNGPITPLISEEIIEEYEEVLLRNKFGFTLEMVKSFINDFLKRALFFEKMETDEKFLDLDDAVFYEVVLTARTSTAAYLITGNKKHFPIKPFVVTPKQMLEIIENNKKDASI